MKKQTFINAINAIEKQQKHDTAFAEKIGQAFPNAFPANLLPENQHITNALIALLAEAMGDDDFWINYYINETEFGKNKLKITVDDKEIYLRNAGDLYDFLTKYATG